MPTYEYKCERCSACFEIKQSYDDKPRAICHLCGGESRRVFRPVPIVFKGSGFDITDHATNKESVTGSGSNNHKEPAEAKAKAEDVEAKPEKTTDKKEARAKSSAKKEEVQGS